MAFNAPTLRKGDQSRDGWVEYLQAFLISYDPLFGGEQGVFDDETEELVKQLQRANGLTEDGVVGEKFWELVTGEDVTSRGSAGAGYVEKGRELRFVDDYSGYNRGSEIVWASAMSLGSKSIKAGDVTARLTVEYPGGGLLNKEKLLAEDLAPGASWWIQFDVGELTRGTYPVWFSIDEDWCKTSMQTVIEVDD
jgi:hypothetical protein